MTASSETGTHQRQHWMGVLARCDAAELARLMRALEPLPLLTLLRAPEPGSVMVRARAGGSGTPFHLGEMTVTRCSVRLASGRIGHGYVQGRDAEHARRAALMDAMLQDDSARATLMREVIEPLHASWQTARQERSRKAAATRVDFFTVARERGQP